LISSGTIGLSPSESPFPIILIALMAAIDCRAAGLPLPPELTALDACFPALQGEYSDMAGRDFRELFSGKEKIQKITCSPEQSVNNCSHE